MMAVVFSMFKSPAGTSVGIPVENGSPVGIVSVTAKKSGTNPFATISSWGSDLGGTAQGPPGSLTQYLDGLGIITGIDGNFKDSISTKDGAAIVANIHGAMHNLSIAGIAFHSIKKQSSGTGCSVVRRHGIEGVLAYFQDYRLGNIQNAGRYTVVQIGTTKLNCAVVGVQFRMLDTRYNLWNWVLHTLVAPNIQAGAASVSEV